MEGRSRNYGAIYVLPFLAYPDLSMPSIYSLPGFPRGAAFPLQFLYKEAPSKGKNKIQVQQFPLTLFR